MVRTLVVVDRGWCLEKLEKQTGVLELILTLFVNFGQILAHFSCFKLVNFQKIMPPSTAKSKLSPYQVTLEVFGTKYRNNKGLKQD